MNTRLKNFTLVFIAFFSLQLVAQSDYKVEDNYTKQEIDIEMRDHGDGFSTQCNSHLFCTFEILGPEHFLEILCL